MKLTHKKRNVLAAIGGAILLAALIVTALALTSCSILNLGGTNEDGTPKTGLEARDFIRSIGDAAIQTWGTQALLKEAPQVFAALDTDGNRILTLAEIEGGVNVEDPNQVTALLVIAITLYQNRP